MEIGFIGRRRDGRADGPGARGAGLRSHGGACRGPDARSLDRRGRAHGREAVVSMLPDGAGQRTVYAEIVPGARTGALLVDCSTVAVASARAEAIAAEAAGLWAVDAPVSGGAKGAAAGTLTFMMGARRSGFDLVRILLVGERLLPAPGRRVEFALRRRLPGGLRGGADVQGRAPEPGGGD